MENNKISDSNDPLVSILMPVYNSFASHRAYGEPLLNQAIDSLLRQSYKNFELIIVDSQSSDTTPDICKSYAEKDKRIKYILDQKKLRAEEAMEFAASIMRGKYCMVANDDDFWHKDFILKLVLFLENHPEVDMAYSNLDLVDVHNKTTYYSIVSEKDGYNSQNSSINNFCVYNHKRNVLPIPFGVFKVDVYKKTSSFEPFDNLRANLDNLFVMKFFLLGFKCHFINERLFFYRSRGRKLSDTPLIPGMPGLDTPILLWLYYARHQFYFFKKINNLIEESGGFSELVNIFLRCVTRDAFISHSIKLLHWIRTDHIQDKKNEDIYKNIIKFVNQKSIISGMQTDFSSRENDMRRHPLVLKKRVQENLRIMNSFSALLDYSVSSMFLKEKLELISDLEKMMAEEISLCKEEYKKLSELQEKRPKVLLRANIKQRFFPNKNPKVSVITTSKNLGIFLRDTMDSITNQSYDDFEHIVIDGASTDDTLQILKEYPHIRLISEKDSGSFEALKKGLALAKGEYILQCAVSDGYIDEHWIEKCVEALDRDKEVSLVWGLPRYMMKNNELGEISYPQFHNVLPPQKNEFIYYWLATNFWLPEGNFCGRRKVFEQCFPCHATEAIEPCFEFNYYFNTLGYLPYFLPTVANFGRLHDGQLGQKRTEDGMAQLWLRNYIKKIKKYRSKLMLKITTHQYRGGAGEFLPYEFSVKRFISKYMFKRVNVSANMAMSLMIYFSFINRKWPRVYNIGRKIYHKLKK